MASVSIGRIKRQEQKVAALEKEIKLIRKSFDEITKKIYKDIPKKKKTKKVAKKKEE